jgi:hypothetical protein
MSISTVAYECPLALGDIVYPEHRDLPGLRVRQRPDQPDQREPGHGHGQRRGQPRARAAGQCQRDLLQQGLQRCRAPLVPAGQPGHLLSERRHLAGRVAAAEPADLQHHLNRPPAAAPVGQAAPVPVMHLRRQHPAAPAGQHRGPGPGRDPHPLAQVLGMFQVQARQVREQHHQQAGFPLGKLVQHN